MQPERVLRFEAEDRDQIERVASSPLPLGLGEDSSELDFFRDVYFDTAAGDLKEKGVTVRWRVRREGRPLLVLDVRERQLAGGAVLRRHAEEEVDVADPASALAGDAEPARLLRALIDPARLEKRFELETMRRVRTATLPEGSGVRLELASDVITVRHGEVSAELYEAELRLPSGDVPIDRLVRGLRQAFGLTQTFRDTANRARALIEDLSADALSHALRASREVALIAYDQGTVALQEAEGELVVPHGSGAGADACRRALQDTFGRPQGRIRLLGSSSGVGSRPALEVWLVENVASNDGASIVWLALDELLARAGSPGLRDARTLAALHVLARSGLATYAAADRASAAAARLMGEEAGGAAPLQPLELLLERLHAADGTEEPSAREVPPELLLNMELSRMSFDERILVMAEDPRTPLLERVLFLSMFGSRRDDFFMTRVARFKDELAAGETGRTIDGLTPAEQLDVIAIRARHVTERAYRLFRGRLLPDLAEQGIEVQRWRALPESDRAHVQENYADALDALITPLAADPTHPFPHIRNLRPALAAMVRLPESRAEHFVAIELPGELPRFVPLPGGMRFVPLEDVIEAALPDLYPGLEVVRAHTFRVTRSAKLEMDDDAVDVLHAIEHLVARRPFQEVVRLEVDRSMPPEMRRMLLRELQFEAEESVSTLGEHDVYAVDWIVDLAALKELASLDIPELHWPPVERRSPFPTDRPVFDLVAERDRMVHFPLDSFESTVERFLREAAEDPDVVSIKITLYRTARDSGVIRALRKARANGKDALALVELKASFDEQRNIEWARGLEEDGIHIAYTPPQIKVHAKIALVVRRENGEHRRYAYIGTGNLNATTAATYIDVGILTADPTFGQDLGDVFNLLTGYSADVDCERLLVAPFNMRRRFLRLIEREIEHAEAGRAASIRAQFNGLADRRLIGALYRASHAGVKIDLMVREICSLRPGVPGVSENIRATSLLGRFLQHARIFCFENGGEPEYFIGSADWRPRNLRERIEVVTPVLDPDHCAHLSAILDETLNHPDTWEIHADGSYVRGDEVVGGPTPSIQETAVRAR